MVDGTVVLDREEEDVVRDRIGDDVDEVADSIDLEDRLEVPDVARLVSGSSSGPSLFTSHLHLKNSPRTELYGYCYERLRCCTLHTFPFCKLAM
jgi:hypothetical protein